MDTKSIMVAIVDTKSSASISIFHEYDASYPVACFASQQCVCQRNLSHEKAPLAYKDVI